MKKKDISLYMTCSWLFYLTQIELNNYGSIICLMWLRGFTLFCTTDVHFWNVVQSWAVQSLRLISGSAHNIFNTTSRQPTISKAFSWCHNQNLTVLTYKHLKGQLDPPVIFEEPFCFKIELALFSLMEKLLMSKKSVVLLSCLQASVCPPPNHFTFWVNIDILKVSWAPCQ